MVYIDDPGVIEMNKTNFMQYFSYFFYALLVIIVFYERDKWSRSSVIKFKKLFYLGLLLLFVPLIINCIINNRYDIPYILDYLLLEELGVRHQDERFFQRIISISYFALLIPIEVYLIVVGKEIGLIDKEGKNKSL